MGRLECLGFPVWGLRGNHQPVQNSRTKVGCRPMGSWSFLITLFQIRNPSGPAFLALQPSSTGPQQTSRVRALWGQPCHHGPGVLPSLRVHFPFKVTSPPTHTTDSTSTHLPQNPALPSLLVTPLPWGANWVLAGRSDVRVLPRPLQRSGWACRLWRQNARAEALEGLLEEGAGVFEG